MRWKLSKLSLFLIVKPIIFVKPIIESQDHPIALSQGKKSKLLYSIECANPSKWFLGQKKEIHTHVTYGFLYIYYMDKQEETKLPVASLFPFWEFTGWESNDNNKWYWKTFN